MSTDPEIQFGDLEEEQPELELRPDRNAHFAVVPYGEPDESELPIFVDMDVLIEMESHALTDTSVELGGIMLGGQLHDEDGRAFVLVQDSVRAQHYEATKGSFKFTHDTWQQITKERDEFPSDWDMVGWYHTHPDWGVFLSGMDMFICDNFFNKPLDIALVIDPCRQDRGFFQWTGDPRERKRRVSGFYVIASRHRQAELENFVAELERGYTMRTDPNLRAGYNVSSGGGAPTIVNISEQRPGWLGQAVVASIVFQTLILLMFGYLAFTGPRQEPQAATGDEQKLLDAKERELALKQNVLDEVIENLSGQGDVASKLEERTRQLDALQRKLAIAEAGVPELIEQRDKFKAELKETEAEAKANKEDYERVLAKYNEAEDQIETLKAALTDDEEPPAWYAKYLTGPWLAVGAVVLVFVGAAGYFAFRGLTVQDEYPDDLIDPPPPEGHFSSLEAADREPEVDRTPGEGERPELTGDGDAGRSDEPPRQP